MRVLLPLRQQQQKKHGQSQSQSQPQSQPQPQPQSQSQSQQNSNTENSHSNSSSSSNSSSNFGAEENSVGTTTTTATATEKTVYLVSGDSVTAADTCCTRVEGGLVGEGEISSPAIAIAIANASDITAPIVTDTNKLVVSLYENTQSETGGDCNCNCKLPSARKKQDKESGYVNQHLDGEEIGKEQGQGQERNYSYQQEGQRSIAAATDNNNNNTTTTTPTSTVSATHSKKKSCQPSSSSSSSPSLSSGFGVVDHQHHQPFKSSSTTTSLARAKAKAKSINEPKSEKALEAYTKQNSYLSSSESPLSGQKSESNLSSSYFPSTSSSLVGAAAATAATTSETAIATATTTKANSFKSSSGQGHNISTSTRKNTKEANKKRKSSSSLYSTDNSIVPIAATKRDTCNSSHALTTLASTPSSLSLSPLGGKSNTIEEQSALQLVPHNTSNSPSGILHSSSTTTTTTTTTTRSSDTQKHSENYYHNVLISTTPTQTTATSRTSSKRQKKTKHPEKSHRHTNTKTNTKTFTHQRITSVAQSKLSNNTTAITNTNTNTNTLKKNSSSSSSKSNNLKNNKMPPLGPRQNSQDGGAIEIGGGREEEFVETAVVDNATQFPNMAIQQHGEELISSNPAEEETGRRDENSHCNYGSDSINDITEGVIQIQDRRRHHQHQHHHHHHRHNSNPQQKQQQNSSSSSSKTNSSKYKPSNKKSALSLSSDQHSRNCHKNSNTTTTPTPTMSEFESALKKRGLELVEQDGDGNCLFRAVSFQVYGDANAHLDVRKRCMDFMAKDEEHFSQFVDGEPFRSYIRRKRQDGVHGNNPEIQAISELYNRPVEIFVPENGADPINIFHADYKTCDTPIRLSYHDGEHYNAVIDPFTPTAGLGLGLPGLEPGLADRMQVQKAVDESDRLHVQKMAEEAYQDEMQRVLMESKMEYITEGSLKQSSWNLNNSHHHYSHHRASGDHRRRHQRSRSPNYNASYNGAESSSSNSNAWSSSLNNNSSSSSSHVASIPAASASSTVAAARNYDEEIPAHLLNQDSDEYPQTVQELVMNGFELQKVIKAYDLIGDNFDDLLAFLMSSGS